jgi:radical SAM-linked protein
MAFDKVRIRFRKDGDLRLVSHHDLMRTFERMLRRAGLPVRSTSGFHPKPRLVFALSLPLGVVGRDEVAELELMEPVDPADIRERLNRQAPSGLEILTVQRIDPKAGARVRRAGYRIAFPSGRAAGLPERIAALLSADECWVERTRPHHRRYNLRPYLDQLRLEPDALEMDLLVTPTGTARAEEVLQLLGLDDLLASGLILQRTRLELQDETMVAGCQLPVAGGGASGPSLHAENHELTTNN